MCATPVLPLCLTPANRCQTHPSAALSLTSARTWRAPRRTRATSSCRPLPRSWQSGRSSRRASWCRGQHVVNVYTIDCAKEQMQHGIMAHVLPRAQAVKTGRDILQIANINTVAQASKLYTAGVPSEFFTHIMMEEVGCITCFACTLPDYAGPPHHRPHIIPDSGGPRRGATRAGGRGRSRWPLHARGTGG